MQEQQRKHSYPHPVWAVSPNGKLAIIMDPARLDATEKGFGYAMSSGVPASDARAGDTEGLALMDLTNGESVTCVWSCSATCSVVFFFPRYFLSAKFSDFCLLVMLGHHAGLKVDSGGQWLLSMVVHWLLVDH